MEQQRQHGQQQQQQQQQEQSQLTQQQRQRQNELMEMQMIPENERRTVMLRNIPNGYTSQMLKEMLDYEGFDGWAIQSSKVCEVSWSHPQQGLAQHIERYRNSPVMHESMPIEYKPRLFQNGREVPFPRPTKAIRPVKLRPAQPCDENS